MALNKEMLKFFEDHASSDTLNHYVELLSDRNKKLENEIIQLKKSQCKENDIYLLGLSYHYGDNVAQNYEKAKTLFEQVKHLHHAQLFLNWYDILENQTSQKQLLTAIEILNAFEYKKDHFFAIKLLNKANSRGYILSALQLIVCYFYGYGVNESKDTAFELLSHCLSRFQNTQRDALSLIIQYLNQKQLDNKNLYQILYDNDTFFDHQFIDSSLSQKFIKLIADSFNYSSKYNCKTNLVLEKVINQVIIENEYPVVGELYLEGIYVEQNLVKAVGIFQNNLTDPLSDKANIGKYYAGIGDYLYSLMVYEDVIDYYQQSAKLNEPKGILGLANCYFYGRGIQQDYALAFQTYQRVIEIDSTLSEAYLNLGKCYAYGLGVESDGILAMYYFSLATNLDSYEALFELAIYLNQHAKEVSLIMLNAIESTPEAFQILTNERKLIFYRIFRNYAQEMEDFESLAEVQKILVAFNDADALYFMAQSLKDKNLQENQSEIISLLKEAVKQNHIDAKYLLVSIYYDNDPYDPDQANKPKGFWQTLGTAVFDALLTNKGECFKLMKDLAENSQHDEAQRRLGAFYQIGYATDINIELALKWYKKSADQNNEIAQTTLGKLYLNGVENILKPNSVEAIDWFTKSADQGNSEAQVLLGICYIEQNNIRMGLKYLYLALHNNYSDIEKILEDVGKILKFKF